MAQEKKAEKETFVYVASDAQKTPVDFAAQPKGTKCILVTPGGMQYEIMAGTTNLGAEPAPELAAKIERAKTTWDSKDEKFPNLKITRE
jgi:hypothetical protein